jgi:hypothetical protein
MNFFYVVIVTFLFCFYAVYYPKCSLLTEENCDATSAVGCI